MRRKLLIITTHPIQYYAPIFKLLARHCDLKVLYTWGTESLGDKFDPDFGKSVKWDIPLLDGYVYEFLDNIANDKGSHHFNGIDNPKIIAKVKEFDPDVILVYGWSYKSHLKVIRHFKNKKKLWFRGDSNLIDEQGGIKKILRSLFLRWVYAHIDKAFYVGKANKAYYLKFGLRKSQLVFAPHAIDNDRFAAERNAEARQLRNEIGVKEDEILIVFAGKFELKKDPEILLSAFLELQLTNVHLLFVGDGNLKPELLKKAGESKKIYFKDFQNQSKMPVVYQACDIFCLPSQGPGETWGLVVNEAMAAGKAILVSDKVGCAADLVEPGLNGFIFKATKIDDLKEKLSILVANKQDLREMGDQSRKIISNWSFDDQVNSIIENLHHETT